MKFPKNHQLTIYHNEHHTNYETIEEYFEGIFKDNKRDKDEIDDINLCIKHSEIWEIQWYPTTPISFYHVFGHTFERCLQKAFEIEEKIGDVK